MAAADKGADAEALRRYCGRYRMPLAIPLRGMKRQLRPGLSRLFGKLVKSYELVSDCIRF